MCLQERILNMKRPSPHGAHPLQHPIRGFAHITTAGRPPLRFALLSPSGMGNLGDAAIIDALIHGVRRRIPDAEFVGLTLNPSDTRERHGIPAFTCFAMPVRGYSPWIVPKSLIHDTVETAIDESDSAAMSTKAKLRTLVASVPGARSISLALQLLRKEANHRLRIESAIPQLDALIVTGGGQLDEYWGGPFGHPYTLWRWARFARRKKVRFLVLSVGTGTLEGTVARRFVLRALGSADYRSYRDGESRRLIGYDELTQTDPVVPDLAYSYPTDFSPLPIRAPSQRRVVAVSPMVFHDPRIWPNADPVRYQQHLRRLTVFVDRLVRDGWEVLLFPSDLADRVPISELLAQLELQPSSETCGCVYAPRIATVEELLALIRKADVVVAARLHGVLLAHVVGRPVFAIAHDRKVVQQMADVRQSQHCVDIDDFDPHQGQVQLQQLWERRADAWKEIQVAVASHRLSVETQYDLLFGMPRPIPSD